MDAWDPRQARRNRLLNGLSNEVLADLTRDLQPRDLSARAHVVAVGQPIESVYFPLSCVCAAVAQGNRGIGVEVATLGNDGMSGLPIFLGVDGPATFDIFVQRPGTALSMPASAFRGHLENHRQLRTILGCYTQALITQLAQGSACNRLHSAEQRCARWLLMTHDRVDRDDFELTHEFIAQMLGVRRATVTEIASALQDAGAIRYARGIMTVVNRGILRARCCECYEFIQSEYARLLPAPASET
ncbi:MAG TPA: Crp/Fnr family transcriptional regulator [Steroidobacteraceae bacterium]|nr:Crp/Fnr family transcriptional regulator [Steroidobacteraceae bacterium]